MTLHDVFQILLGGFVCCDFITVGFAVFVGGGKSLFRFAFRAESGRFTEGFILGVQLFILRLLLAVGFVIPVMFEIFIKGFQPPVNRFQLFSNVLLSVNHIPEMFIKPRHIHNFVSDQEVLQPGKYSPRLPLTLYLVILAALPVKLTKYVLWLYYTRLKNLCVQSTTV
jgi:hypothetical protein